VGTSGVAVDPAQTTLGAELARKAVTLATRDPANRAIFETFFAATEAIGTLREMGVFGNGATATPNSGDLFARALIDPPRDKTGTMTLTVRTEITVSR